MHRDTRKRRAPTAFIADYPVSPKRRIARGRPVNPDSARQLAIRARQDVARNSTLVEADQAPQVTMMIQPMHYVVGNDTPAEVAPVPQVAPVMQLAVPTMQNVAIADGILVETACAQQVKPKRYSVSRDDSDSVATKIDVRCKKSAARSQIYRQNLERKALCLKVDGKTPAHPNALKQYTKSRRLKPAAVLPPKVRAAVAHGSQQHTSLTSLPTTGDFSVTPMECAMLLEHAVCIHAPALTSPNVNEAAALAIICGRFRPAVPVRPSRCSTHKHGPVCWRCGERGHYPFTYGSGLCTNPPLGSCYFCGIAGHHAKNCTNGEHYYDDYTSFAVNFDAAIAAFRMKDFPGSIKGSGVPTAFDIKAAIRRLLAIERLNLQPVKMSDKAVLRFFPDGWPIVSRT